jgi:uncharacterized protein (TIGR02453 family)
MAGYFGKSMFDFLKDLAAHNDRAWFAANKERYERDVRDPFLEFIANAGTPLRKLSKNLVADPKPTGGSMFRIYRDTRFSKDKSPYKTNVAANFRLGKKDSSGPGYYLHIEPGESFIGGGIWQPDPELLSNIRHRIIEKPAEWKKVRAKVSEHGDTLKRPPAGFDPAHPMIDDIKRKSFTGGTSLSDKQVLSSDFMTTFIKSCKDIEPLMKFLAGAAGSTW